MLPPLPRGDKGGSELNNRPVLPVCVAGRHGRVGTAHHEYRITSDGEAGRVGSTPARTPDVARSPRDVRRSCRGRAHPTSLTIARYSVFVVGSAHPTMPARDTYRQNRAIVKLRPPFVPPW